MFCTKCGAQNPDGAAFCINCGNSLQAAEVQGGQPQVQYAQPPEYTRQTDTYTYPQKKSSKGLMIGLIIGGVALVAGIVVLVIVLTGGNAGGNSILGTWYDQSGYVGTVNFNSNGTIDFTMMGQTFSGEYTYDSNTKSGEMTILGDSTTFYMENGMLNLEGVVYTKQYVDQQDLSDLNLPDIDLSDFGLN